MRIKLRNAVRILTVTTVILSIAIAFVFGEMRGVLSQQPTIKELMEKQNGIIVDFSVSAHPLYYPLLNIASLLGVCWIVIAVKALSEK